MPAGKIAFVLPYVMQDNKEMVHCKETKSSIYTPVTFRYRSVNRTNYM